MILKNAKIYIDGLIRKGALLIHNQRIELIRFGNSEEILDFLREKNEDGREIDCQYRLLLPGIIDIHTHLRDMGQSEKETFFTGTKAAAYSGITTLLNMPNTKPPAINIEVIKQWMRKAENNIYVNVGFIAGVPSSLDIDEFKSIINLGVFGFKIYPLGSINGIDWTNEENFQKLLKISSELQIIIFIHPDWPQSEENMVLINRESVEKKYRMLKLHNLLYPNETEERFVRYTIDNYNKIIRENELSPEKYPIVHFCHVSCKESYSFIQDTLSKNQDLRISFEITPHHLFLSNIIKLANDNFGKVLPPLRDKSQSDYLYSELKSGKVKIIATDHAPHTIEEKSKDYLEAPSGFPGLDTYPLLLLDKVSRYELSLDIFVKCASENPAKLLNLNNKGFIKEGYDADIIIVEKIPEYPIISKNFKSKAKFSPYEGYKTTIKIWKVFLNGIEINNEETPPSGNIIRS